MENNEQLKQAMAPIIAANVAAAIIAKNSNKEQIIEDTVEITKGILDKLYA